MSQGYKLKNSSISYVVPTLNSAATLDMTLLCLRSQKNVDVHIIVVDSGSTDGTLNICKRWDVKTLYAEPGNMYRAINTGLRECDTEWLAYLNSDDWLYPDSVARLLAQGNTSKADVVYGNCDFTDVCGRFMYSFAPPKPSQLISTSRTGVLGFAQQSAIFRYQLYKNLTGFNEVYHFSADKEFYLRALQIGASFTFLPGSPVACFRLHTNQISNRQGKLMAEESKKINPQVVGNPSFYDWVVTLQWRWTNLPHYLLRFLRQSLLSRRMTMSKSMSSGTHLDNVPQVISND